jgi:chemotaxis family two-component system response regulator Rcp1
MKSIAAGGQAREVLLVEDSIGDVRLTREAFRELDSHIRLHVASDGVEAMAFLRREGSYLHAPRPELILLDLNLPKMDGREVLARIKKDDSLKTIPTIVLTTSDLDSDIESSYQLQVNCYIQKPEEWDQFSSLVKNVVGFWLTKVKLPLQAHGAMME